MPIIIKKIKKRLHICARSLPVDSSVFTGSILTFSLVKRTKFVKRAKFVLSKKICGPFSGGVPSLTRVPGVVHSWAKFTRYRYHKIDRSFPNGARRRAVSIKTILSDIFCVSFFVRLSYIRQFMV